MRGIERKEGGDRRGKHGRRVKEGRKESVTERGDMEDRRTDNVSRENGKVK